MAQLQLALDGDLASALEILSAAHPYIDLAEVGTPLVFREGMTAVRRIRELYPLLALVADLKIMDAGEAEADIAFSAGADIVTAMAAAADATIAGALDSARAHGKRLMVDMMQVADTNARGRELAEMGCDLLCLHRAHDQQAHMGAPFAQLAALKAALPACWIGDRRWRQPARAGADPAAESAGDHRRLGHHRRCRPARERQSLP